VTLIHSSFDHATGFPESILNEKFPDMQASSGVVALAGGSCPVGVVKDISREVLGSAESPDNIGARNKV
jgi:hypothetical protein